MEWGCFFIKKIDYNLDNILKNTDKLVEYDDYIPTLIRFFVDSRYYTNLTKNGSIDKVLDKINETRFYTYDEQVDELNKWLKDNPQFIEEL